MIVSLFSCENLSVMNGILTVSFMEQDGMAEKGTKPIIGGPSVCLIRSPSELRFLKNSYKSPWIQINQDYAHQIILAPPDFQTFLRPWNARMINVF